jgi:NAD(P)-dependent dehydrogenase (short-subunit alcohol dehydrogenase family)
MASVFVTGSSAGIGQETARQLVRGGHRVVLHARDDARAKEAAAAVPEAVGVAVGDLSVLAGIRRTAASANDLGPYDAVIHNAGVGSAAARHRTADGGERIFAVNVLGPYLLTALMPLPARLVYLSSGLQAAGRVNLDDLQWERRPWNGMQAYRDSKLYDILLAFAVARRHPELRCNAVDPGWIKTKMGGGRHRRAARRRGHAGMACHERRASRRGDRPLPQVAPRAAGEPGRLRHRPAGWSAGRVRRPYRSPAAQLAGLQRAGGRYSAFAHPGRTRPAS